jgi:uracil-DNA glycosylase
MCKGSLPADVMLIGEAPGESEDVLGQPFVGPAGKLLDRMLYAAFRDSGRTLKLCFTNLVGCIPKTLDVKRKKVEPLPSEIATCAPRVDGLLRLAKPRLIIAVGELSQKQAKAQNWEARAKVIHIQHPAFLLRLDVSQQGLAVQKTIINLADAFSEIG